MSTTDPHQPAAQRTPAPTLDELFASSEPVSSADDLACDGVFDDGEVERFVADLYAMRHSDVA